MSNRVSAPEPGQVEVETVPLWRRLLSVPPALRYPQYRAYWFGTLASVCGFQMLMFAQGWLTYELTGSPLYLGYVAVASAIPSIALNLFGGVFADKLDKRKLIFYTQILTASLIFTLAFLTLFEVVRVWHIIALAFAAGAVNAFDQPARQALYPHLIDRHVIMSAVALNSAVWQGTRIVAPAVAGTIIGLIGTATAIFVAGAGFVIMAIVILTLRIPRIDIGSTGSAFGALWEGLRFIAGSSIFSFLIVMTFFNSFFGMAYITMMPAIAVDVLKVGADGQGLLMTVGGCGRPRRYAAVRLLSQLPAEGTPDNRRWACLRHLNNRLRTDGKVCGLPPPGHGSHVHHGHFQLDLHDLNHEFSATSRTRQDARSRDGLLRDDVEHHATRRDAGRRISHLRGCTGCCGNWRRSCRSFRTWAGTDKPTGPKHQLDPHAQRAGSA